MAASIKALRTFPQFISLVNTARMHTGGLAMAGGNWREKVGMSRTGTSYGPLTDIPDWSYVDGRPSPMTSKRQTKRKLRFNFINKRVKTLLKEVDLAKLESKTKRSVQPGGGGGGGGGGGEKRRKENLEKKDVNNDS